MLRRHTRPRVPRCWLARLLTLLCCLPACLPGLQVRTLPKVLKYLPSDKAQDARNYVNSLQYWLGGNDGA